MPSSYKTDHTLCFRRLRYLKKPLKKASLDLYLTPSKMGACLGKKERCNTQDQGTQTTPDRVTTSPSQQPRSPSLQRLRAAIGSQSAQEIRDTASRPSVSINPRGSQSTGAISALILPNTAPEGGLPPPGPSSTHGLRSLSSTGSLSGQEFPSPASSRDSITHPPRCSCQLCTPNMRADARILTVRDHVTGCRCDHCHIRRYNYGRRPSLFGHG
jgi:hypothetical protein